MVYLVLSGRKLRVQGGRGAGLDDVSCDVIADAESEELAIDERVPDVPERELLRALGKSTDVLARGEFLLFGVSLNLFFFFWCESHDQVLVARGKSFSEHRGLLSLG